MTTDPTDRPEQRLLTMTRLAPNMSKAAVQHTITLSIGCGRRLTDLTPAVVSIQRLRPGSQTVTSAFREQVIPAAPFDIRVVLTEHPNGIALDKTLM